MADFSNPAPFQKLSNQPIVLAPSESNLLQYSAIPAPKNGLIGMRRVSGNPTVTIKAPPGKSIEGIPLQDKTFPLPDRLDAKVFREGGTLAVRDMAADSTYLYATQDEVAPVTLRAIRKDTLTTFDWDFGLSDARGVDAAAGIDVPGTEVYVVDSANARIQVLDATNGGAVRAIPTPAPADPWGISVEGNEVFAVTPGAAALLQVYDAASGTLLREFDLSQYPDTAGTGFYNLAATADRIYVLNEDNSAANPSKVLVLEHDGSFVRWIKNTLDGDRAIEYVNEEIHTNVGKVNTDSVFRLNPNQEIGQIGQYDLQWGAVMAICTDPAGTWWVNKTATPGEDPPEARRFSEMRWEEITHLHLIDPAWAHNDGSLQIAVSGGEAEFQFFLTETL